MPGVFIPALAAYGKNSPLWVIPTIRYCVSELAVSSFSATTWPDYQTIYDPIANVWHSLKRKWLFSWGRRMGPMYRDMSSSHANRVLRPHWRMKWFFKSQPVNCLLGFISRFNKMLLPGPKHWRTE